MTLSVTSRGTAGPTVILVHGWGFSGRVWDGITARLEDRHRCLAVDLPGFGYTPPPESEYTLRSVVRQLTAELPTDALWIGWSLGSLVAMQAAMDNPASVRSLLLVAGTPSFRRRADWPHAVEAAVLEAFAQDLVQRYEQTLQRFILLQVRGSEAAREVARSLRNQLHQAPRPAMPVLEAALRILQQTDLRQRLGAIRCPVNVLLGERDTLVPRAVSEHLHTLRPEWRIEIIPGAGHAPFLSHPDLFCDRVRAISHVPS